MVNISPMASGRLESSARTLFGRLLKGPNRGNSPILAAPLVDSSDSDNGGGVESKRAISFFLILFSLVRVLGLLLCGVRSWDSMNWGFGDLARVLDGLKGENFKGWSETESILRGTEEVVGF